MEWRSRDPRPRAAKRARPRGPRPPAGEAEDGRRDLAAKPAGEHHQHTAWQPPFISLMAEVGAVVAMTVDGAVLECRASTLDKTKPAL
jgi:hypothetical protein